MIFVLSDVGAIENLIQYESYKLFFVEPTEDWHVTLYFADTHPINAIGSLQDIKEGIYVESNHHAITVLRLDLVPIGYDLTESMLNTPHEINSRAGQWGSLIYRDKVVDLMAGSDLASLLDDLKIIAKDEARRKIESAPLTHYPTSMLR
jgi:hypothetical protein